MPPARLVADCAAAFVARPRMVRARGGGADLHGVIVQILRLDF